MHDNFKEKDVKKKDLSGWDLAIAELDRELEELEDRTRKLKSAKEGFSKAREYGWPFSEKKKGLRLPPEGF